MIPQKFHSSLQSKGSKVAGMLVCGCMVSMTPAVWGQGGQASQPSGSLESGVTSNAGVPGNWSEPVNKTTDRRSVKELAAALKSGDRTARGEAAASLGQSKDSHAMKPLIEALKDKDPYVRAFADMALIRIGAPAIEPLISAMKDNELYVAALSALALTSMKDARAHAALMKALSEHNSRAIFGTHTFFVRIGVPGSESALIEALEKFPSREMAEEFLNSGNPALQKAANDWALKYKQSLKPAPTTALVRWGMGQETSLQTASNPISAAQ
jgi:hypothetical protein